MTTPSYKVLVVDDSTVFRSQIKKAINGHSGVEVAGIAANGKICLQKLRQKKYDLIVLDLEMPEMNGIETIKKLKSSGSNVKIIVFSSHTVSSTGKAIRALSIGADDIVTKPFGKGVNVKNATETIRKELLPKILQFVNVVNVVNVKVPKSVTESLSKFKFPLVNLRTFHPRIIVIGSSTGGPRALEKLFSEIVLPLPCPILITQHMPAEFTKSLALRLEGIIGLSVREGLDGEEVRDGHVYIAPGDFHMSLGKNDNKVVIRIDQGPKRNFIRPCVDYLFESASVLYGDSCLGIVLTGMGSDGVDGAIEIKKRSGAVMIQDEDSCSVFGMPGAVYRAKCYDLIDTVEVIARNVSSMK